MVQTVRWVSPFRSNTLRYSHVLHHDSLRPSLYAQCVVELRHCPSHHVTLAAVTESNLALIECSSIKLANPAAGTARSPILLCKHLRKIPCKRALGRLIKENR
jgi:hypothetical protein